MPTYDTLILWLLVLAAYLLGSVPWGLVFTRAIKKKDVRKEGSGNIGATNVRRVAGFIPAILTLMADMAKGAVPVFLCMTMTSQNSAKGEIYVCLVALSSFLGHLYPCFLKFKGGKGVATAAGCFLVISPLASLSAVMVFVAVVALSNRVSAGSLSAAASLAPAVWLTTHSLLFSGAAAGIALFVFVRHKENIKRLIGGREPGFREKK